MIIFHFSASFTVFISIIPQFHTVFISEISPCTHSGATYTVSDDTHTKHCRHCTTKFEAEPHDRDENGECKVCHSKGTTNTVTIYLPIANEDGTYNNNGAYQPQTYAMVPGTSFTLPEAPQDLQDMDFAGWLLVETLDGITSYMTSGNENLLPERDTYTLNDDVSFVARYKDITIRLADDNDNEETLYKYNGKVNATVALEGRTLYKDGYWNTLCLPFAMTAEQVNAQLNPKELMTLSTSSFSGGTLTLDFEDAQDIEAGKPYIVKWDESGSDIENPTFTGVTISNDPAPVETPIIDFIGTTSPVTLAGDDYTKLYLGSDNALYYPSTDVTINSCRVYFHLKNGLVVGETSQPEGNINAFRLNFGDDEASAINNVQWSIDNGQSSMVNDQWYDLSGRKLNGKPTAKGIYINNGTKVVIK